LKVYLENPILREQRATIAEWLANTINDKWKRDDFEAYKPNEDKDDFWTVDRNNNFKLKFFNDNVNAIEIIHRYSYSDAVRGLSYWLAYSWDGEVIE
jgi:hypothetical protein